MAEKEFSYLPSVHPHNHNNVNMKKIQVTYYMSFTVEKEVASLVAQMDSLLDRLVTETDEAVVRVIKHDLYKTRKQLMELEYFDIGGVKDVRQGARTIS